MLNPEEGNIFCFNKPYTMTSFRLVSKVRGILCHKLGIKKMKVGHAGTLDPLATGVLIVCTGKATKQIDQLQAGTKEYVATLKLGATTPSFDMETEEDGTYPTSHITRELVDQTLQQFIGAQHLARVMQECDDKRLFALLQRLLLEKIDEGDVPQVDTVKHAYCGDRAAQWQAVILAQNFHYVYVV